MSIFLAASSSLLAADPLVKDTPSDQLYPLQSASVGVCSFLLPKFPHSMEEKRRHEERSKEREKERERERDKRQKETKQRNGKKHRV